MLPKSSRCHSGFTLVEIIVTLGIIGVVLSMSMISLSNLVPKQQTDTSLGILKSDIANQQQKSLSGDQVATDGYYGVHFETDSYTLFANQTYSPTDPQNSVVDLPPGQQFAAIDLPNSSIIFSPISGEVFNYDLNASSAALLNTPTNVQIVVSINPYGVLFVN